MAPTQSRHVEAPLGVNAKRPTRFRGEPVRTCERAIAVAREASPRRPSGLGHPSAFLPPPDRDSACPAAAVHVGGDA